MNKPNLIIPGFPKSGTSSLYDYITTHPKVFRSMRKESHIYSFKERFNKRTFSVQQGSFTSIYSDASTEKYIVDASTTYMISEEALYRIKEDTPDAKIIIIARDPIERIESHYNWIRSEGISTKSFRNEIREWIEKPFDAEVYFKGNYKNYIEFSQYGKQIERCLRIFPKKQVLIIPFERLKTEKQEIMDDIFNFLELESIPIPDIVSNKTKEGVLITKEVPLVFRSFKFLFPQKIRNKISLFLQEKIFGVKIRKYKMSKNDKKWVFDLLKNDIDLLNKLGYRFDCWKSTNSFYQNP